MANNQSPEQIAELEEKLKKMSPEELKNYQRSQCIFCQIAEGKAQTKKVYEDKEVIAVLDINPANPGHIIIIPREHYMIMPQIPEDVIGHIFNVAKDISQSTLRALGAEGNNIIVANGLAAGQKSQHFMVHVIPRKLGDNLIFSLPQLQHREEELEALKEKMIALLTGSTRTEKKVPSIEKQIESPAKNEKINIDDIAKLFK